MVARRTKPAKPRADFPLYAHASGQWAKTILGRTRYSGAWSDPTAALHRYNQQRDALYAGREPGDYHTGLTVGLALDSFLSSKLALVRCGELAQITYDDYRRTCKSISACFTNFRSVETLRAHDFEKLRLEMAGRFGVVRLAREVTQVKMVFKYAYEAGLIERPIRFGLEFKAPKDREFRKARAAAGPKLFEPHEIHRLLEQSTVSMRAMTLLGINCGFEPHDCGKLQFGHVNLETGWHVMPRPKTWIDRRCKLWPETVDALQEVINNRRDPRDDKYDDLIFITSSGGSWARSDRSNSVCNEFRKLLDAADLYRPKRTFMALRHTLETVGGESIDQVALNHIMGHVDRTMAARYRESISSARLETISEAVHKWFAAGAKPATKEAYRIVS